MKSPGARWQSGAAFGSPQLFLGTVSRASLCHGRDHRETSSDELEQVVAHLPEDLDARFAGVDTKLAQIREVQALHTTRFSTLEQKLNQIAAATAEILRKLTDKD